MYNEPSTLQLFERGVGLLIINLSWRRWSYLCVTSPACIRSQLAMFLASTLSIPTLHEKLSGLKRRVETGCGEDHVPCRIRPRRLGLSEFVLIPLYLPTFPTSCQVTDGLHLSRRRMTMPYQATASCWSMAPPNYMDIWIHVSPAQSGSR